MDKWAEMEDPNQLDRALLEFPLELRTQLLELQRLHQILAIQQVQPGCPDATPILSPEPIFACLATNAAVICDPVIKLWLAAVGPSCCHGQLATDSGFMRLVCRAGSHGAPG